MKNVEINANMDCNGWNINVSIQGKEFRLSGTTQDSSNAEIGLFWDDLRITFLDDWQLPMDVRKKRFQYLNYVVAASIENIAWELATLWENKYGD